MNRSTRKIAIIGAGLVGSSCAYSIVNQGICEELVLIDINHERAVGEAMDLSHCMNFTNTRTKIYAGTYEDCKDMDIIIVTAGPTPKPGQSRLDTLRAGAKIMESVVSGVMESGFQGIFLIASNPVDIMTYQVWKLSGLPRNRVIGTGTSLDSSRLRTILSEIFEVDPRSIHGYSLGQHGDSQMVAWSHVTVGGKPILQILEEQKERFADIDLDSIVEQTAKAGLEISKRKGTTYYGTGNSLAYIARSIFNDDYRVMAVSTILDGEYGEYEICTGVPAIITRDGIKEIVELNLTEAEESQFAQSNDILRDYMKIIGY
ncbi:MULTISPECIES: L-lactate dehydrogenase [unclassified Bacillus (in: firmicutes)]|uniref:L-lactate dehydrogenase n=1 Tax=unclassified Bacillus (in: firmicutes) TaxID=185979 RepID=UPI0008F1767C|nr:MULTISPECIES: L-lactate dehydrogenase [unclassified Bacillus (in: firmicutes)]SFJ17311.1 malate dehydrogenase (NAD) [Bacillus sp. 71mf]SFT08359.1 malate dehydrogenase (NAD) [Bacillus sp. 103mf]